MNIKIINTVCFLIPFIFQVFNLQNIAALSYSEALVQIMAYGFLALLIFGVFVNVNKGGEYSKTANLWFVYYITYYGFAILALGINSHIGNIVASFVPVIYMISFYVYLSFPENMRLFEKVALISFVISSLLNIYLFNINWSIEFGGIHIYDLGRAAGVYGDAGRSALISILAFILVYKKYNPNKILYKFLKLALLILIFYSIIITFATTGLFAFAIIFFLLNHRYFNPKRFIVLILLLVIVYFTLFNINDFIADYDLSDAQIDKVNDIVNILTFNVSEVNRSGRDDLVLNLLHYVYQNPIIGNGIGFSQSVHGHNTYVGIWGDAGIFTLLVFLIMLFNYFKNAIKCAEHIRYFALSLFLCLFIQMISSHSVINQGLELVVFVYLAYVIDENDVSEATDIHVIENLKRENI